MLGFTVVFLVLQTLYFVVKNGSGPGVTGRMVGPRLLVVGLAWLIAAIGLAGLGMGLCALRSAPAASLRVSGGDQGDGRHDRRGPSRRFHPGPVAGAGLHMTDLGLVPMLPGFLIAGLRHLAPTEFNAERVVKPVSPLS